MTRSPRGSVTVEVLILTPVIVLIGLFALSIGRWSGAQLDVQHAADSAARAASMVSADQMATEARQVATIDLLNRGSQCTTPVVTTAQIDIEGMQAVRVNVSCDVNSQGVVALGMTRRHVEAESLEFVDVFTFR